MHLHLRTACSARFGLACTERNQFLPNDSTVGTFLLINAAGAVLAYLLSGPVIDRRKKPALAIGAFLVIVSMVAFALVLSMVSPAASLALIFGCSLVLGFGANAVAAGHALLLTLPPVGARRAESPRRLLRAGLATLPLFVQTIRERAVCPRPRLGLGTVGLFLLVLTLRFPGAAHQTLRLSAKQRRSSAIPRLAACDCAIHVRRRRSFGRQRVVISWNAIRKSSRSRTGCDGVDGNLAHLDAGPGSFFETDPRAFAWRLTHLGVSHSLLSRFCSEDWFRACYSASFALTA